MPGKKIPQDPKGKDIHTNISSKQIPDVSPRPEAKDPIDITLCEPDFRARPEITCQSQLLDHVRMNVNGQNEDFNSARQTTQEMKAYRRGE